MPGCSVGINAMADHSGEITTGPTSIARLLKEHWGEVFKKKEIDHGMLGDWLKEYLASHGD